MTHRLGRVPYLPRPPSGTDPKAAHDFSHTLTNALHQNLRDILMHIEGIDGALDILEAEQRLAQLTPAADNFIVGNGTAWATENPAAARTSLGLVIGTDVQAFDADLSAIAALAKDDGNFIVGDGSGWVAESGATARTSLGLGSSDSPTFAATHAIGAADGDRLHLRQSTDLVDYVLRIAGTDLRINTEEGAGGTDIFILESDGELTVTGGLTAPYVTLNGGFLNIGTAVENTIVAGVLTVSQSFVHVRGQGGAADDLNTINGGTEGDLLWLRAGAGEVITIKNGVDNIFTNDGADLVLSGNAFSALFLYNGTRWIQERT